MDCELEQLGERIAEQAAHLDAAMHRLLTDLREFDKRGGWHVQGALSCAHWLAWRVGWSLATARDHVRVARRLEDVPSIDDALRRGELSYSKVRAMVRIATPANEPLLLEYSQYMTGSQLEMACRKYAFVQRHAQDPHPLADLQRRYVRRRDTEDGWVKLEAVLQPEEAEMVWKMLNHAATQLSRSREPASTAAATAEPSVATLGSSQTKASSPVHEPALTPVPGVHASELPGPCAPGSLVDELLKECELRREAKNRIPADDRREFPETEATATAAGSLAVGSLAAGSLAAGSSPAGSRAPESAAAEAMAAVPRPPSPPGVLQQRADATQRAFNRADALVWVAQSYLRGDKPNRAPIEIVLTIPASSLRKGVADPSEVGEIGESLVSCEAARRISCDGGAIEIVEDENGAPLSVGRKRRTISGMLKRALHQRDQMCTYPGCTNRLFLEGHHIRHWADGGETSLSNATLLCTTHHVFVHEYGYTIELDEEQRARFRDPHGRVVVARPPRPITPDLGWPRIRAQNEGLGIDADTNACKWDGKPVHYGAIVDQLVIADRLH